MDQFAFLLSSDVGNLSGGWFGSDKATLIPWSDLSYKMVAGKINGSPGPIYSVEADRPKVESHMWVRDLGTCTSTVEVKATASDPFYGYAPGIHFDVTWWLYKTKNGGVKVSLSGSQTKYPAFEGLADGRFVYGYKPKDTVPGLTILGPLWGPAGTKLGRSNSVILSE